jgi:hypothetical protein
VTRNSGQMYCKRCWRPRHGGATQCPVTFAIEKALQKFRDENGPNWKSKLLAIWEQACGSVTDLDERSLLQQARNVIGPSRLYKIRLPKTPPVATKEK